MLFKGSNSHIPLLAIDVRVFCQACYCLTSLEIPGNFSLAYVFSCPCSKSILSRPSSEGNCAETVTVSLTQQTLMAAIGVRQAFCFRSKKLHRLLGNFTIWLQSFVIRLQSFILWPQSFILWLQSFILCLQSFIFRLQSFIIWLQSFIFWLQSFILWLQSFNLWLPSFIVRIQSFILTSKFHFLASKFHFLTDFQVSLFRFKVSISWIKVSISWIKVSRLCYKFFIFQLKNFLNHKNESVNLWNASPFPAMWRAFVTTDIQNDEISKYFRILIKTFSIEHRNQLV